MTYLYSQSVCNKEKENSFKKIKFKTYVSNAIQPSFSKRFLNIFFKVVLFLKEYYKWFNQIFIYIYIYIYILGSCTKLTLNYSLN